MAVQALTQTDPNQFFNLSSTGGPGTQRLDTKVGAIAVSNDLTGQLTVTTAEGDKVTLSAHLAENFSATTYQGTARQNGTNVEVSGQQTQYSLSQELGLTVEGDLSEQEVKDLSKLFKKVLNIFRKFFNGNDEAAVAKTAKLADKFSNFSSLSGLDLNVNVERSVSLVAAQLASESNGQTTEPTALPTNSDASLTQNATPGAAPSTAAAIPPPSTGTTAPTQPSTTAATTGTQEDVHLTAPATEGQKPKSLVQQVLDAVRESQVDSHKLRRHLPRLLDKVREDLQKELRGQTEPQQTPATPAKTGSAVFLAYQSRSQISFTLSIHS